MPWESYVARPSWWPDWVPARCGNGHPLLPGKVSISRAHCSCLGATTNGHNVWWCAADGCGWHVWPPEHEAGGETAEPPRVL